LEGDPISLAKKRSATFWNRKIVLVSTPTNKGASRIEEAFQDSDQRHYHVPCKHCHHYQHLVWANVRWTDSNPDTAAYMCKNCSVLWSDSDRRWAVRNGKWTAHEPFNGVAGFTINGIYSPWTPLSDGVRDFLSMRKNAEQLRVWTNTYLGETWDQDQGEAINDHLLSKRKEDYSGYVPDDVVALTCGIDVQDNRLELSIIGYGKDFESFVIDHRILYGDPSTPQLWLQLDTVLFASYERLDGGEMTIMASAIDSGGHFTNSVYSYCKKNAGRRIFAIKGVGGEGRPVVGRPSKNNIGRCPLFPVGVDTTKHLLFARMKIDEPGAGYIHFNDSLSDEYFKQLTAEKVVTTFSRGYKKRIFKKSRDRNEALDCFVYSMAALAILNLDLNTLADRVKFKHNESLDAPKSGAGERKKMPFVPKTNGGFVNSWR